MGEEGSKSVMTCDLSGCPEVGLGSLLYSLALLGSQVTLYFIYITNIDHAPESNFSVCFYLTIG